MSILDRIAGLFSRPLPATPAPRVPPPPPATPRTPISDRSVDRRNSDIATLQGAEHADVGINLSGCRNLRSLPEGLTTGTLTLSNCTALETLPGGMSVAFLDLDGCTALKALPGDLKLRGGRLNLKGCAQLTWLPKALGEVAILDLSGCTGIDSLPAGLTVTSWIDVADSGIRSLPELYDPVGVRWNGVAVSRQLAFAPETLSREQVLAERDPEVRALMLARTGYEA